MFHKRTIMTMIHAEAEPEIGICPQLSFYYQYILIYYQYITIRAAVLKKIIKHMVCQLIDVSWNEQFWE